MNIDIRLYDKNNIGLTNQEIDQGLIQSLQHLTTKKILIIPPDITRFHSKAGYITNKYYQLLKDNNEVDILPALGTHAPMTKQECEEMFGDVPFESLIVHDWRNDVIKIGEVPASFVSEITEGLWKEKVTCEINKLIIDDDYDLIISIGQVVPHEVIGMANHSKNLLVGCGGRNTINESHMIGAVYGMERMMGKDNTPVRRILDYALTHFLNKLPIVFVLTVTTAIGNDIATHGLFIGPNSIVYLDPKEFKSTWLGNKAIYRTRMAIEDGGELIILAPGITRFGEDKKIDELIRSYGYFGRVKTLESFQNSTELQQNMSAAAHLIHGSSEERFKVTYAVKEITQIEIEQVNFNYANYDQMIKKYNPKTLKTGWNILPDNEEVFYIPNPALGLWIDKNKF